MKNKRLKTEAISENKETLLKIPDVFILAKLVLRGLGKTIQTIAFLAAVYEKDGELSETTTEKRQVEKKGPVVIVCPSSVIYNWEIEFSKWAPFSVAIYHGVNRDLIMDKVEAQAIEILITSFDTYRICGSMCQRFNGKLQSLTRHTGLRKKNQNFMQLVSKLKPQNVTVLQEP
ncbi:hypothetical protein RJ639_033780 [Escallonia herrerae]|uniref:SNF2 N-terminal domain-containing protein n=1 Tax=Escallonia herrerae TaxID=1293975 RepID=A0AA88WST3_9ASTE|nr:hypothetical protein RJ639_033780 [Escallonia herrerae]